ncbi:Alpha-amylase A type-1/2 [Sphaceloma murrayae]|uniref:alpha-amylase n=1 Tax=Sphaceloma murrayae TaxID=2082308 RepID=A0A2K1R197_9PEZI|nr:Alpha-amylase A type-1/2 [Sphaceloma murrayae]
MLKSLFSLLWLVGLTSALNGAQWRSQTIYQVIVDRFARTDGSTTASCNVNLNCGGSWRGLINKLDYIQGMGFTAVWISPVVKNIEGNTGDGSAYHGYWAQDINQLNQYFGTAQDLKDLSNALHARGMYLMVDVVPNHMGFVGCGNCVNYGTLAPFNSQSFYHSYCTISYDNQNTVENCWLGSNTVSLPDLRTEDSNVRNIFNTWIKKLVTDYSIDGLRIDTAAHIEKSFYPGFLSAAGVYAVGEVYNGDPAYSCPYQEVMDGVLNFPAYYWITQAFQSTSGNIGTLVNGINQMISTCRDTTLLGSFVENHDIPRFASLTSDLSLIRNAITFTLLADGIPILYQGQEQQYTGGETPKQREPIWSSGYNTNSNLYNLAKTLNAVRRQAINKDSGYVTYKARPVFSDSRTIVMRKGTTGTQIVSVTSNRGSSGSGSFTLTGAASGFTASQSVTDVIACRAYTADGSGNLAITISGGQPVVLFPSSQLSGSGLCGGSTLPPPSTTTLTTSTRTTSASTCATPSTIATTFRVRITTSFGQNIRLVGSTSQLGSWNPANGVALSASSYTAANPVWTGTVSVVAGTTFQYKFVRVESDGSFTWEADPNRSYSAVGCSGTAGVDAVWQS